DNAAATHHPDVLALLRSQLLHERFDRLFDEFEAGQNLLRRLARKHVVPDRSHVRHRLAFFYETDHEIVSFSSQQNRVNRFYEGAHAVIAFRPRPVEPINAAIFARDKTVGAGGERDDDFSFGHIKKLFGLTRPRLSKHRPSLPAAGTTNGRISWDTSSLRGPMLDPSAG